MKKWIMVMIPAVMLVACSDDSGTSNNDNGSSSSGGTGSSSNSSAGCSMPTSCSPDNGKDIQVVCPQGGEEYAPGDTVHIIWRANVVDFNGFVPEISLDGGNKWVGNPLSNGSIEADPSGEDTQCFEFSAVVPKDGNWTPDGKDESDVMFRVRNYDLGSPPSMKDASKSVTILSE